MRPATGPVRRTKVVPADVAAVELFREAFGGGLVLEDFAGFPAEVDRPNPGFLTDDLIGRAGLRTGGGEFESLPGRRHIAGLSDRQRKYPGTQPTGKPRLHHTLLVKNGRDGGI